MEHNILMKGKQKMKWNVIVEDFNSRKIVLYDIFTHSGFKKDVLDADKKCETNEEFLDKVKDSLSYYFWAKCEYEVFVESLFVSTLDKKRKIDAYEQVMMNWDVFANYLISNRKSKRKM